MCLLVVFLSAQVNPIIYPAFLKNLFPKAFPGRIFCFFLPYERIEEYECPDLKKNPQQIGKKFSETRLMGRHTITKLMEVKETILKVAGPGCRGIAMVKTIMSEEWKSNGKDRRFFNSNTRFWKIIV